MGSLRGLELELCAWGFLLVLHPTMQHGTCALGRTHRQAYGNPLDGQGCLFSEARSDNQLAGSSFRPQAKSDSTQPAPASSRASS